MYRNRFTSGTSTSTSPANGVYGSNKAGTFLKDVINGTDCLDIVMIGDSNISRTDYGYTGAFNRVLYDFLKVRPYATPLYPGGIAYLNYPTNLYSRPNPTFTQIGRGSNNNSSQSKNSLFGTQGIFYYSGNHVSTASNPKFIQMEADNYLFNSATGDSFAYEFCAIAMPSLDILSVYNFGGAQGTVPNWWFNQYGTGSSDFNFSYGDFAYAPIFIRQGQTYTSAANNNYIEIFSNSPLRCNQSTGAANTTVQYRVVHGIFVDGPPSGKFSLSVWKSTGGSVVSHSGAGNGYSTGTPGVMGSTKAYDVKKLDFPNMPSGVSSADSVRFGFDGLSTGSSITGPFVCLWHSVIDKGNKGFSVSPFIGRSGITSDGVKKLVSNNTFANTPTNTNNTVYHSFFEEILNRQKENSNGTGRALVVIQQGINDWSLSNTFADNTSFTIQTITKIWSDVGGNKNNLAFLVIPSHPTFEDNHWTYPPVQGGSYSTGYRKVVVDQIPKLLSQTETFNTTIVDIEKMFSGVKTFLQGYSSSNLNKYFASAGGQAHLSDTNYSVANGATYPLPTSANNDRASPMNGYDANVATIIDQLTNIV